MNQIPNVLLRERQEERGYTHERRSCDHGSRNTNQGIPVVLAEFYVIYYNVIINIQLYEIHMSVDDVRLYVIIVPCVIHTICLIMHRDFPCKFGWQEYPEKNATIRRDGLLTQETEKSCWENINIANPVLVSGESGPKVCSNGDGHSVPLALFRI